MTATDATPHGAPVERVVQEGVAVVRGTGAVLAGRDVARAAAALTYFGAISVVPWLLLALWSTSWTVGADAAEVRLLALAPLVPGQMGARPAFETLVHAGTHLGWLGALVTVLPASFWGEGVRRACLSLVPREDSWTGWRARAWLLPVLVVVPALTWVLVGLSDGPLLDLARQDGFWPLVFRVLIGFTALWLTLSVPLAWVFRHVAPRDASWTAVWAGSLGTAAFLAGFLHGFLLFLSIPVDVGVPFGGLGVVGGVVSVGFWLYLLHTVLLVGWVATTVLDRRLRASRPGPA
ncbi:MAG: YhjD/YihY/BrkB family envelope integrity protein [Nocardioidaceae bacterium]|nr:YhjD/YihY/BrkB family envelope integrity protein [Nocardioidaceae bacterium]